MKRSSFKSNIVNILRVIDIERQQRGVEGGSLNLSPFLDDVEREGRGYMRI